LRHPFTDKTHGVRLRAKFRLESLDRFILSPSGGENLQILSFCHLAVSPVSGNLRKLNTSAQLQTFPYQRHQNRFCTPTPSWRNPAHTLTFKSVMNKQTKNSTFLAALAAGEIL